MDYRIITALDSVADKLEACGRFREAFSVDIISNLVEKIASNPSAQSLRKDFGLPGGDLDKAFIKKIQQIANSKGFKSRFLGDVGDSELLFIEPKKRCKGRDILIVSGTHGNEQAGPFGLLHYLERVSEKTLDMVNLSFIPLLNPTGFRKNSRDNQWGEKTNRNYDTDKEISREGKIIKENLALIKDAGKDGMITMHEDPDAKVCFIYMYHGKKAEELGEILLGVERMFFNQRSQIKTDEKGGKAKNGIVWDRHEGSLEDWLNKGGIPIVATTETPGKLDFDLRVQANTVLLNAFVDFYLK